MKILSLKPRAPNSKHSFPFILNYYFIYSLVNELKTRILFPNARIIENERKCKKMNVSSLDP